MYMKKDNVKLLTFGVAFSRKFKILDLWGEIADNILYESKYFSPEFFPNISTAYTTERRLYNNDKKHLFLLSSNNLVFTQEIEKDFNLEYNLFKKRVEEYIVPQILSKYTLVSRRLGMVYFCECTDDEIKKFSSKYFNSSAQNIMDFRFSQKEATKKGLVYSNNSDFINKIFTVGNLYGSTKGISYDYQEHFNPAREDVRNLIKDFMSSSFVNFENDIINDRGNE